MKKPKQKKGFGLVSKIGSILGRNSREINPDNIDTSRTSRSEDTEIPRKNFNIQLSQDDQDIFVFGEEEEEEEESEGEEEGKKITKINQDEPDIMPVNKDKKKEEEIEKKQTDKVLNNNQNKNNINRIVKEDEKVEDFSNNKTNTQPGPEKKMIDISENINIINTSSKEKQDSLELYKLKEKVYDNSKTCHIFLKKGNDIVLSEYSIFPVTRMKKKKGMFQIFKKQKLELVNYNIFFNEYYLYFSKDIIYDKNEKNKRRINSIVSLFNIIDININTDKEQNNKFNIRLEVKVSESKNKIKEFSIDNKIYRNFFDELCKNLDMYGIESIKKKLVNN